jgi:hypothetical protein
VSLEVGLTRGFDGRLDVTDFWDYGLHMELVPDWPTTAGPAPEPIRLLDRLQEFEGHHVRITVEVLRCPS